MKTAPPNTTGAELNEHASCLLTRVARKLYFLPPASIGTSRMRQVSLFFSLLVWLSVVNGGSLSAAVDQPNIVMIMTDNQGAWTLGCYGNPDIRTPRIDQLARDGLLFSQCYSSNPVCSPTRATWLTGLLPSQHGVHCYVAQSVQMGPKAFNTIAEFQSLPEILSAAGYTCGLSGKWHLGDHLHAQEGFRFWVTKPGGHTTGFYDQEVIENGAIKTVSKYTTEYWTDRGIEFIEKNKGQPFFLLLAYNGPYGLSPLLLREARNRHASFYADKPLPSFPREQPHPWLFNNRDYLNNIVSIRRYAAEVSGVDDGVGRVMDTLRKHNLDDNTLVVFMADQGLAGGHGGLWGMGDHTRPLSGFDSTMHVPLIFRWPGRIPANQKSDLLVSNYDFLPSLLRLLGLDDDLPQQPPSPGRDFSSVLTGAARPDSWEDVVYYEFEKVRAIRTSRWKLLIRIPDGPHELYDLANDPGERSNLFGAAEHAETIRSLRETLEQFFRRYADPKYDLAADGISKAGFLLSDR
jgi:arylsulfatase A-like enzyme